MLYKRGVLSNLAKIDWKAIVLKSLFNKTAGLTPAPLLNRHFSTGFFLKILGNF